MIDPLCRRPPTQPTSPHPPANITTANFRNTVNFSSLHNLRACACATISTRSHSFASPFARMYRALCPPRRRCSLSPGDDTDHLSHSRARAAHVHAFTPDCNNALSLPPHAPCVRVTAHECQRIRRCRHEIVYTASLHHPMRNTLTGRMVYMQSVGLCLCATYKYPFPARKPNRA